MLAPRGREKKAEDVQAVTFFVSAALRPLASATNNIGSLAYNVIAPVAKASSGVLLAALPALAVLQRGETHGSPSQHQLCSTHFTTSRGCGSWMQAGFHRKKGGPSATHVLVAGAAMRARQQRMNLTKSLAQGKGSFSLPQLSSNGRRIYGSHLSGPQQAVRPQLRQASCAPASASKPQEPAAQAIDWSTCLGLQSSMM